MTVEEAVEIMGDSYLEWSRAKARGDLGAMRAAMDRGTSACLECDDPETAMKKHIADRDRLSETRIQERLAGKNQRVH